MKKIASRLLKTIILAIFVFPSIHPGRMGINILFMNANVDLFHDSTKNSSEILTSESNEIGSLKIIMPDKLNQLTARSSYICHIDDFVKGNKDYYGFDINKNLDSGYQEIIDTFDLTQEYNSDIQDNIRHYNTLFTCPPYWNTEVYSNIGAENLSYENFLSWWKNIVHKSNCSLVAYQINRKYKNGMNQQLLDLGYNQIDEIIIPTRISHFNRKNGINNKTEYESIQIFIKTNRH